MNSDFTGQIPIGILAVDDERRGFNSRFFARLLVVHFRLEPLKLGPAQVHAQQDLRPVLRLGAARARMDRHDGVARIVVAGEQCLGFDAVDQFVQAIQVALQFGVDVFAFTGEIKIGADIIGAARQVAFQGQHVLQTLALTHHLLRSRRIRPEVRIGRLLFDLG